MPNAAERVAEASVVGVDPATDGENRRTVQMALPGTYPVELDSTLVSLTVSEVSVAPQQAVAPVSVPSTVDAEALATAARAAARVAIETCFDGGMTAESLPTARTR